MLSTQLRELEAEGIIERTVVPDTPVRVDYRLTDKGRDLERAVGVLSDWADRWVWKPVEELVPKAPSLRRARSRNRHRLVDQLGAYSIRPAEQQDVAPVTELVNAAYGHYVERIGMMPRPMTDDYEEVIRTHPVTVAENDATIVGVIVLSTIDEGFVIDNVAVHPSHRGKGLGKALLQFAEAEATRAGFESIHLYTHERMTENLVYYSRIGYVEYDRRSQGEFSLVYMRKQLS